MRTTCSTSSVYLRLKRSEIACPKWVWDFRQEKNKQTKMFLSYKEYQTRWWCSPKESQSISSFLAGMHGAIRELLNTTMVRTLMYTRQTVINSGLFLTLPFFAMLPQYLSVEFIVFLIQQIGWAVGFPVSRRGRQGEAEPQKKGSCWSIPRAGGFPYSTSAWLAFCSPVPVPRGCPSLGEAAKEPTATCQN